MDSSTLQVAVTTEKDSSLSICIPRVDYWVTDEYIRKVFSEVLISESDSLRDVTDKDIIDKIDLIVRSNEKNETYKRAFIHFKNWHILTSRLAGVIWNKIRAGEVVKIMHAQPSYWKCSLNRVPRPQQYVRNAMPTENNRTSAFVVE